MARVRTKDGEDISDANVARVIAALEADKPITKKEACQMLKISYNTTRLNKIISEYKERKEYSERRRKQLRNTPLDNSDKRYIINAYLSGASISEIAENIFRSTIVVKNLLKQYNIPIKNRAYSYFDPVDIEPEAWAEDYKKGDLVYSARYNVVSYIDKKVDNDPASFRIWLTGDHARWAYQPFYELVDLRSIQKEFSIKVEELDKYEIQQLINEGLLKARKRKNDK